MNTSQLRKDIIKLYLPELNVGEMDYLKACAKAKRRAACKKISSFSLLLYPLHPNTGLYAKVFGA